MAIPPTSVKREGTHAVGSVFMAPESGKPLTRSRVLEVALAILDREGHDALSMRRVAEEFGVTPMALYNHIRKKQDLLQGIAELVVSTVRIPSRTGPWDRRLRSCCGAVRRACLAHPHAVPIILQTPTPGPTMLRLMEAMLIALDDAGLDGQDAVSGYCALMASTMGHISYQLAAPVAAFDIAEAVKRDVIRPDEFPRVFAASSVRWNFDRAFADGLAMIIDGIANRRRRGNVSA